MTTSTNTKQPFLKKSNSMILRIICINLLLLALMFFGSSLIISHYSKTLYESALADAEKAVDSFCNYTNTKFSCVGELFDIRSMSNDLAPVLTRVNTDFEYACSSDVSNFFSNYLISCSYVDPEIYDLYVIPYSGFAYHYDPPAQPHGVLQNYPFLKDTQMNAFLNSRETVTLFYNNSPGYSPITQEPVISLAAKIYNVSSHQDSTPIGIFLINYRQKTFDAFCQAFLSADLDTLLFYSSDGTIQFSTIPEEIGTNINDLYTTDSKEYTLISSDLNTLNLTAVGIVSQKSLFENVNNMRRSQFLIISLCMLVSVVISWFIFKLYSSRVNNIVTIMQESNIKKRIPVTSSDELALISTAYNDMCDQTQLWIDQHYKAKIQLRTAELHALTMQINPHFIYNTLENIRMKALINNDEEVGDMITRFGMLFRWTMHTEKPFIYVEEELEYINSYLYLQSFHFADRLQTSINVEDTYMDCAIPRLILQPIVENAITHGFSAGDTENSSLCIQIEAFTEGEDLIFQIQDNGRGMTEERLQTITASLHDKPSFNDSSSIGLNNVHNRLRLLFGAEYGVQIQSIEGQGTTVFVRIPKKDIEEMNTFV